MPEEQQPNPETTDGPTWVDFKPPVLTTPFADGRTMDVSGDQKPPQTTAPLPQYDGAQAATVEPTPLPPVATPPVVESPPQPPIAEPPIAPAVQETTLVAPVVEPPSEFESRHPVFPDQTPATPVPTAPSPEPVTQPTDHETPQPVIEQTVEPASTPLVEALVPESSVSAVPVELAKLSGGINKFLPWVAGGLLATVAVGAGAYFWYNQTPTVTPTQLTNQTENTAILADSQAPASWESNYSTSLLASERGGLELLVTDPPTQVLGEVAATDSAAPQTTLTSLTVTIAKIDVHLATQTVVATGVAPEATKSAEKAVDRWETLRLNQNSIVDLMDLRNRGGILSSLGVTYLAAGNYTEMRLYLTSAVGKDASGQEFNIDIPDKNGIVKIVKPFNVTASGTVKMVVDFDAPKSVVKVGDTYQLVPSVAKILYNDQEI